MKDMGLGFRVHWGYVHIYIYTCWDNRKENENYGGHRG